MKKQLIVIAGLFLFLSSFAQDEDLQDDFLLSVQYNEIEDVKKALAKGADINGRSDKGTHAGEYAMFNIDEGDEMIVYLLDNGLDPMILDDENSNLLHIAAENEGSVIMPRLVALGCPIDAKNDDGSTPLHLAAENSDMEAFQTLVDLGADVTILNDESKSIVQLLELEKEENWSILMTLQLSQQQKNAALYESIYELENLTKTAEILEKGADPNSKDEEGVPMIIHASEMEEVDFVKLLLENGADVNATNEDGYSALWFFYKNEVLKLLIDAGIDVNLIVVDETPLTQAIYLANIETVHILLDAGADPKQKVDGKNANQYCQDLMRLEHAPGVKYEDPQMQKEHDERYKTRIKEISKLVK